MSDYANISHEKFPQYRESFRELMGTKDIADIRAFISVLYKLKNFTEKQFELIIDDMKLLEIQKVSDARDVA